MIKEKAKELGAGVCGIGDIKHFIGDDPQRNPLSILPNATCIIGFGIPIPKGLYMAMDEQRQYFNYTNLAVKYTDETLKKWLKNFYRRFFTQQFKRSCSPDGVQVTCLSLSPRGGFKMPSDGVGALWLNEAENL